MATTSEIAVEYAARGAKRVQRADQEVRESIQTTAKTARQESGTINRWMQRHKSALLGIGAATTAAMAGIINASPTLSAHLSTVRLGFSLLAMEIGQDTAPVMRTLGDLALDLAEAYGDLPDPIRTVLSHLLLFGGAAAAAAAGLGGITQLIFGMSLVGALQSLAGALSLGTGATLGFAGAIGVVVGLLGVWALQNTGVLNSVENLGSRVREFAGGDLADLTLALSAVVTGGMLPLIAAFGGFVTGVLQGGDLQSGLDRAEKALSAFTDPLAELADEAADWGADLVAEFARGMVDNVPNVEFATRKIAGAVDKYMPGSPADVGPLSTLDEAGPGLTDTLASGMESNTDRVSSAAEMTAGAAQPSPAGGGGRGDGGTTIDLTFERGAVQVHGARDGGTSIDERDIAEETADVFDKRTSGRGRL